MQIDQRRIQIHGLLAILLPVLINGHTDVFIDGVVVDHRQLFHLGFTGGKYRSLRNKLCQQRIIWLKQRSVIQDYSWGSFPFVPFGQPDIDLIQDELRQIIV